MKATTPERPIESFEIVREIEISAPIHLAFEAMLEQIAQDNQLMDGKPYPIKLEPFPGGRYYRDLGDGTGHLWGHIQVIKPPKLLEIRGPLMMSFPAMNHVQWRFTAEGERKTRLSFTHRAAGRIPTEFRDGMPKGWEHWLERITRVAEQKAGKAAQA